MNENETLFRKKSLDRISSPEQLDEYLKVTNPSVWLILLGVVVLLVGVVVWSISGRLETKLDAVAIVSDHTAAIYIPSRAQDIETGMMVRISDREFEIAAVHPSYRRADNSFPGQAKKLGGYQTGEILDEALAPCELANGIYSAKIITERISPIRLIIN